MSERYTDTRLSRRAALRGVALFLGAPLLASLESGCNVDPQQRHHRDRAQALQAQWSPPPELERLGVQVVRFCGPINEHIDEFIRALDERVKPGEGQAEPSAQSVSEAIHALHLESAIRGEWVEVSGWRLSRVEAAAYALIATR